MIVTCRIFLILTIYVFITSGFQTNAQTIPASGYTQCGTSGIDGTTNISSSINTYFQSQQNVTLTQGASSIELSAVPGTDRYGNNFGTVPIASGDLLLIIQSQDAGIDFSNTVLYGSGNPSSGPDNFGATGFTSLGNSGKFEYVVATNTIPLTGGLLKFKGSGLLNGTVYRYINTVASPTKGKSSFQVVRVPQYANLRLVSSVSPPPFNGSAGGVIVFEVSGNMNFNGFTIDVSARGFRGGYSPIKVSVANISDLYVTDEADPRGSGKGEGIAGTPRFMWDGYNAIDNVIEGLPGGSCGRGAPANAGGGGNDSNAGGGGGGNGASGGVGGWGYEPIGGVNPSSGRPGSSSFNGVIPDITRIIMGGGGGGGHANDALTGVKGGVGGGIIIINAGTISGKGTLLANGGAGSPGVYGLHPDGSGGGGGGGSVLLKVSTASPTASITINAIGGVGGNTENDPGGAGIQPHGPGGGGAGGVIFCTIPSGTFVADITGGASGKTNSGNGITHFAQNGLNGYQSSFAISLLPPYLMGSGAVCFPDLSVTLKNANPLLIKNSGDTASYNLVIHNKAGAGISGKTTAQIRLPYGFSYVSSSVSYTGLASGPQINPTNESSVLYAPVLGEFNIPGGDSVVLKVQVKIGCILSGIYNASAEAVYLDPTRDYTLPFRQITAIVNAFPNMNTTYAVSSFGPVPGLNFDGTSSSDDDIIVKSAGAPAQPMVMTPPAPLCKGSRAALSIVSPLPAVIYNWYSSTDSLLFTGSTFLTPALNSPKIFQVEAVNQAGCISGKVSVLLTIKNCQTPTPVSDSLHQVFIANAFTPNGDGHNDLVYVHSKTIREMFFYIYDQWGELLFTTSSQQMGWDGTFRGAKEPVGVYVYYLKAVMNDGQQLIKKGTITLLR